MFDQVFIKKAIKFGIFFLVFTILFVLFFATISYTFPFVLAIVIALLTRPITLYLKRKLKMSNSIASLISTIFVFVLVFSVLTIIFFKITLEAKQLVSSLPNMNTTFKFFQGYIDKIRVYYDQIDPSLIEKIQQQLTSMSTTALNFTMKLVNWLISFAISLPLLVMIIFITFLATYFFSRDIVNMEDRMISIFSVKGKENAKMVWNEAVRMVSGYAKAYSTLIAITFVETLIGFSILGVKYALILSILSAIFDVLPILGISAVYLPVALIYLLSHNYVVGIGIIILYVVVTIIRQIMEPKLVSTSLGIHPVAVLAAIFIGIKAYGFIGMIYLISLIVMYKILKKAEIL